MRLNRILILVHLLLLASITIAASEPVPVNGEITRINQAEGKVTLRHGPIPNLDMDGMSGMVFPVADPAMLSGLKPGDRVVFEVDRVNGQITVIKIGKSRRLGALGRILI